jgi:hypothetical protein
LRRASNAYLFQNWNEQPIARQIKTVAMKATKPQKIKLVCKEPFPAMAGTDKDSSLFSFTPVDGFIPARQLSECGQPGQQIITVLSLLS